MEKRKKRTRKIDTRSSRDPDFFTQNFSSSTPATGSQETPDDDGYGIATDKKQGRQSRPTTKVVRVRIIYLFSLKFIKFI